MADVLATHSWQSDLVEAPTHVAIIMDGNGRWANERNLPRAIGHRMGVEAVRRAVKASIELGIEYLTLYSFSTENWTRPQGEISDLMGLMKRFIRRDLADLHQSGVRILVIGERTGVDSELITMIDDAVRVTAANTKLTLVIAFNYGSRSEIANAAQRLADKVATGQICSSKITAELLGQEINPLNIPDPDLLIRTSGEERLSNFLLWQCAYTEFVFLEEYWPDFDINLLRSAITRFQRRERRFGGLRHKTSA
ncbi:MAG: isoprenyl transferase [Hyphomicrobiaceae bacterium TMED74]|nr:di-trans,poly-cis-decaprenylcistransferase [Filomicrobium sp.]RPG45590.1 MAG: isoprenyl transferase [Hyphomicrobiaceae bacterium TMED74]